jgi:hypothetical protein
VKPGLEHASVFLVEMAGEEERFCCKSYRKREFVIPASVRCFFLVRVRGRKSTSVTRHGGADPKSARRGSGKPELKVAPGSSTAGRLRNATKFCFFYFRGWSSQLWVDTFGRDSDVRYRQAAEVGEAQDIRGILGYYTRIPPTSPLSK